MAGCSHGYLWVGNFYHPGADYPLSDGMKYTTASADGEDYGCYIMGYDLSKGSLSVADGDDYAQPDVVLVCVKGYSLEDTIPFIQRVAKLSTIVIPVLNIYGTGAKMQEQLPELLVTDGCIYVSANIKEPGVLIQHGKILRVVYGVREKEEYDPRLEEIKQDFDVSGIDGVLSENIRRDALEKFSYVSPIGAAGLYYHATAADFQRKGEEREAFKTMIREITALAEAMGVPFERDMVEVNLKILSTLASEATTSMQRDVMDGKSSEIDGLVYEVVRMGERYHVPVPMYEKVAEKLKETL